MTEEPPHELVTIEEVKGKGVIAGLLLLRRAYIDSLLEGWAKYVAIQRLEAHERYAKQEAKAIQAENERLRARQEYHDLTEPPELPLSIYQADKENPDTEPNTPE
jgi:hypothetical protein